MSRGLSSTSSLLLDHHVKQYIHTHTLISILVGMLIIDRKDLNLEKRLGKGNFGEVWRAKYKGEKDVAVKMTLPNLVNDYEFVAEAKLMM